jgi:hypothetical protein
VGALYVKVVMIASNADLKFLPHLPQSRPGTSNRKAARARPAKVVPVLRPVARQVSVAHDLFGKPEATLPDHAQSYIC